MKKSVATVAAAGANKQFGLLRIVRFLSGLSSLSSSQMRESMLIQIVPAA